MRKNNFRIDCMDDLSKVLDITQNTWPSYSLAFWCWSNASQLRFHQYKCQRFSKKYTIKWLQNDHTLTKTWPWIRSKLWVYPEVLQGLNWMLLFRHFEWPRRCNSIYIIYLEKDYRNTPECIIGTISVGTAYIKKLHSSWGGNVKCI